MNPNIQYKVVGISEVQGYLQQGWKLYGSPYVLVNPSNPSVYPMEKQALVKEN